MHDRSDDLQPPLILGSASPRRAKLLRDAGFTFTQQPSPFDEDAWQGDHLTVAEQVRTLALQKAHALAEMTSTGWILTADTLLSVDDRPLGKPVDRAHAQAMLDRIIGRTHQVFTGVCLLDAACPDQAESFVDVAQVALAPLPPGERDAYLASNAWQGKAGGYNLAELEHRWSFDVQGDPTTVVGLPMVRLTPMLRAALRLTARRP